MKTIKFLAAAAACIFAISSCTKPQDEEITVSWTPSSTSEVFNLGESKTIAATAENIDYVEVASKPDGWTVNATVTGVTIKAPAGTESNYVLAGKVQLNAINREESKTIPVLIDVSVDESKIAGVLEMKTDVSFATLFKPGESKEFIYDSAFLKSVSANCGNGWKAVIDDAAKKITVTAPAAGGDVVVISSVVTVSGESITGTALEPVRFDVSLEAYLLKASDFAADVKAFGVTNQIDTPVAFAAREGGSLKVYVVKDGAYLEPKVLENELVLMSDGSAVSAYEGTPMKAVVAPYTVKDIDGNEYATVMVRGKVWMDQNLRTTKNPKGVAIEDTKVPGGIESNIAEYGRLYNKTQAFDGVEPGIGLLQGICPDGWHIPVASELSDINYPEVLSDDNPDATLIASMASKPAGAYMSAPQMGVERALLFGQFSLIQLADPVYVAATAAVPSIPDLDINDIPKSLEFQAQPAFFIAVRCVKNINPFL